MTWFRGGRPRTLRGGSWNNNQENARVAARNDNNPDNSNNNIGVRVVGSHGLWGRPEMSRGSRCGTEARADDRSARRAARPAPGRRQPVTAGRIQNSPTLRGKLPNRSPSPGWGTKNHTIRGNDDIPAASEPAIFAHAPSHRLGGVPCRRYPRSEKAMTLLAYAPSHRPGGVPCASRPRGENAMTLFAHAPSHRPGGVPCRRYPRSERAMTFSAYAPSHRPGGVPCRSYPRYKNTRK